MDLEQQRQPTLRRAKSNNVSNTRAEFRRLKTIVPSIRRKENVSNLDIILEAIKYIDDLQDQLVTRLGGGNASEEEAKDMPALRRRQQRDEKRALLRQIRESVANSRSHHRPVVVVNSDEDEDFDDEFDDEDEINENA